jgi:geranylgeranylglycerol-phosphate geranylgeranyltransferase
MSQIKGLVYLIRPFTSLTGAITTMLGCYVAGSRDWHILLMAGLVAYLVSASSIAWNDFLDHEIDKINQPQRAIPAGLVSPRAAWIFSIFLAILAVIVAYFIHAAAFWVALLACLMLYFYSWKLKSTVLLGNLVTASIAALSVIFGGVAAGNILPTIWLAAIIITTIMSREVLKTMADYEGDLHQKCRTIATVWGKQQTRRVYYVLACLSACTMMVPYLFDAYKPIYAYMVALGIYPVAIYIILRVNLSSSGRQLEQLSQLMKYNFLVWFLAVFLGAS